MPSGIPLISAKIFDGFDAFLSERGVGLGPLLEASGIEPDLFADPTGHLSLTQATALFELSAQQTRDPCLGLHWAEGLMPGSTGVFGYAILNAATLREAMQAVARYLTLVVHPATVNFEEDAIRGILRWHLSSLTTNSTTQYVGFSVAATVLRLRAVAGPGWSPLAVELTHRELPCGETVRRIFGPNIEFNAPVNSVCADPESLDRKSITSDPRLFDLIEQLGQHQLDQRPATDVVAQCSREIVRNVRNSPVSLETIADNLGLTARALQSKLAQAGSTFDAVLQDTRKDLAIGYLRESDLTLTDVALLLGFSELSAFSRATHRWFGMPPSAYRQELRGIRPKAGS